MTVETLAGEITVDGVKRGFWEIDRVTSKPIRREPEPILDESAAKYYETHPMGNDVHRYQWRVVYDGVSHTSTTSSQIEHKAADGWPALIMKVLGMVWS